LRRRGKRGSFETYDSTTEVPEERVNWNPSRNSPQARVHRDPRPRAAFASSLERQRPWRFDRSGTSWATLDY